MSVRIRLSKTGKKHQISFRIVAQEARTKRDGKFLEILGFWRPTEKGKNLSINQEALKAWVAKGAQVNSSVAKLMEAANNEKTA